MEVDEFLLNGAVKALDMGIHFRGTWIGMPMADASLAHAVGEVFVALIQLLPLGEFSAVVGEDKGAGYREDGLGKRECCLGHQAVTPGAGECKRKAGMGIDQGNEVALEPVMVVFDRVQCDAIAGEGGGKVLGLTRLGGRGGPLGMPVVADPLGRMAHLVRRTGDESADGARTRQLRCLLAHHGPRSACNFSLPKLGWACLSRRISAVIACGQVRCRWLVGAVERRTNAATLPPSARRFALQ